MDFYVVIAAIWLVSVGLATAVGYSRGRTGDALTLGSLLGPVGLLLTFLLTAHPTPALAPVVLKLNDGNRAGPAESEAAAEILRRAA